MDETKTQVKRTLLQLSREFGNVLAMQDIFTANPDVSEEDVMKALNELEEDGLITIIDKDSVQVNV